MGFKKPTLFISHSTKNSEIAIQLTSLLRNIGVSSDRIFCSSVLGQGIKDGEKLNNIIHTSLKKANLIIYILSDAFINSSYCMEELGVGWYRAFHNNIRCYYLRIPDFEMNELRGFVNSKIDLFTIINESDDIIRFIENIFDAMHIPMQKASIHVNLAKTFLSAIKHECQKAINNKEEKNVLQEQREKEKDIVEEKLKKAESIIESYKERIEIDNVELEKKLLMAELRSIISHFQIMGFSNVVSRDIIIKYKQFWFSMANRYEEILRLLCIEPDNDSMEKLLSQLYLTCKNYEKAYHHFYNAINLADYMVDTDMEFFIDYYPFTIKELIDIYEEKYKNMPEDIVRDFVKDSLNYMKKAETTKCQK